ncbi:MAG: UvrD-helicase domain-containing protein [Eubacteriales bacterium]|jgi:ATP-dependent helicase/nuclease subunit A
MPKLTKAQLSAVEAKNRNILISAAAGSGKTHTLTQRLIKGITDGRHEVSRLCVVTFTRAAAAELKRRIHSALEEAVLKAEGDRETINRLTRQINDLPGARISTIDSFCRSLLQSNFEVLGLAAGVRLSDENEAAMIREAAMEQTLDELSESDGEGYPAFGFFGGFNRFIDFYARDRDDRAATEFIRLYIKLSGYPDGKALLLKSADAMEEAAENGFKGSVWDKELKAYIKDTAAYYAEIYGEALFRLGNDESDPYYKKYHDAFNDCGDAAAGLWELCDDPKTDISEIYSYVSEIKLAGIKSSRVPEPDDFLEWCKDKKKELNDFFKKDYFAAFGYPEEDIRAQLRMNAAVIRGLSAVMDAFSKRLVAEKTRRGVLDFSDLSRLTLKLLYGDDGNFDTPTDAARDIAARYDGIYIDEYQDVNEIQDLIFRAVGAGGRFMVGDIKQSIYRFRGAEPDIFASYRNEWKDGDEDSENLGIFMRENFRCSENIIRFTNKVCGGIFRNGSGRLGYLDEDDLIFASGSENDTKVKLRIFCSKADKAETEDSESESPDDSANLSSREAEAAYIAAEIRRLIEVEKVSPGDIAILFRSGDSGTDEYIKAVESAGIPTFYSGGRGFFDTPEIQLVRCLLNTIDDPGRDIYLVGAMRSPLYGFNLNELLMIRRGRFAPEDLSSGRYYPFEWSVRRFVSSVNEAPDTEEREISLAQRCVDFFSDIDRWREMSEAMPVDELLFRIYRETGILDLRGSESDEELAEASTARRANLMKLYEKARSFENGAFRGLYSFVNYLEKVLAQADEREAAPEKEDSVQLMTVHKSKGLEFPVVFFVNADKMMNSSDSRAALLLDLGSDDHLGAVMRVPDENNLVLFETPMYRAASLRINDRSIDEEMRVLYVALTRAKERLYITAGTKKSPSRVWGFEHEAEFLSPAAIKSSSTFISWILLALGREYSTYCDLEIFPPQISDGASTDTPVEAVPPLPAAEISEEAVSMYMKLFEKRFSFKYPYESTARLPSKLSVSKLYPGVLDDEESFDMLPELSAGAAGAKTAAGPKFIVGETAPTGADIGTATHLFMQFCDLDNVEAAGVEAETERLVQNRFIPEHTAALADKAAIKRFFESDIYREMRASNYLRREMRFNIDLPAAPFTRDEELKRQLENDQILTQGVIDSFFENPDGSYTILDYKTDQVKPGDGETVLKLRHSMQLNYYGAALEQISGKKVAKLLLWSFALNRTVEIQKDEI